MGLHWSWDNLVTIDLPVEEPLCLGLNIFQRLISEDPANPRPLSFDSRPTRYVWQSRPSVHGFRWPAGI